MKRTNRLALITLSFGTSLLLAAHPILAQQDDSIRVVEPETRPEVPVAAIDDERFELGFYTGALSVEDFGTQAVFGIEFGYHLNERWLLQAAYGQASVDRAAFETSQREFLDDDERDFEYLSFTAAYKLIEGRSFFGAGGRYGSQLYLLAGPERLHFADNREWGINAGLGYRLVLTDWLTANVDVREHIVERDFLGDSKNTFNTELRFGLNALF